VVKKKGSENEQEAEKKEADLLVLIFQSFSDGFLEIRQVAALQGKQKTLSSQ
jgi:hypothetical protein